MESISPLAAIDGPLVGMGRSGVENQSTQQSLVPVGAIRERLRRGSNLDGRSLGRSSGAAAAAATESGTRDGREGGGSWRRRSVERRRESRGDVTEKEGDRKGSWVICVGKGGLPRAENGSLSIPSSDPLDSPAHANFTVSINQSKENSSV